MPLHLFTLIAVLLFTACSNPKKQKTVIIYISEDQVFSEPLIKAFEKEKGIHVKAIYDSEESKGTGVMNRLIAEKNNPQADVYWANEPIRAEILKQKGLLAPYQSPSAKGIPQIFKEPQHYWTGFSARIRLFIVHENAKYIPNSVLDYANPTFKGKGVLANPLFGSTTAHIATLFTIMGEQKAKDFLNSIKKNHISLSTSNGESADFVAKGFYDFALVDSDDALSRLEQKAPIKMVYPDQGAEQMGAFVIPNTLMLIKNAPHPDLGKELMDYLLSKKSEEALAFAHCHQIPLHQGVNVPKGFKSIDEIKVIKVNYHEVAKKLTEIQAFLKAWVEK